MSILIVHINLVIAYFSPALVVIVLIRIFWVVSLITNSIYAYATMGLYVFLSSRYHKKQVVTYVYI